MALLNSTSTAPTGAVSTKSTALRRRDLWSAAVAHATHDGLTDLIYVLLPIWQVQFGISYAMAGLMRGTYAGFMAVFQMQASKLAGIFGIRAILVLGTGLAGLAYVFAAHTQTLIGLMIMLSISGLGASTQHPLASGMVATAYEGDPEGSRSALATYNFAGDIGKMAIPAAVGLGLGWWSWQTNVLAIGLFGLAVAGWLAHRLSKHAGKLKTSQVPSNTSAENSVGPTPKFNFSLRFYALLATGVVDTATRMGFLTFLPFVLKSKGANATTIGLALSLLFVGGAVGKLVCGYLGRRIGVMKTVWLTESLTAIVILAVLQLPLVPALLTLPLIGMALNGTSSVLYGSVPELVPPPMRVRAFAMFYTGTIGGSAVAPIVAGLLGDALGISAAMECVAAFVCLTLPLAWIVVRRS